MWVRDNTYVILRIDFFFFRGGSSHYGFHFAGRHLCNVHSTLLFDTHNRTFTHTHKINTDSNWSKRIFNHNSGWLSVPLTQQCSTDNWEAAHFHVWTQFLRMFLYIYIFMFASHVLYHFFLLNSLQHLLNMRRLLTAKMLSQFAIVNWICWHYAHVPMNQMNGFWI